MESLSSKVQKNKILSPADRIANARKNGRSDMDCDREFIFINSITYLYLTKLDNDERDYSLR